MALAVNAEERYYNEHDEKDQHLEMKTIIDNQFAIQGLLNPSVLFGVTLPPTLHTHCC
jgi:hypothetical protein